MTQIRISQTPKNKILFIRINIKYIQNHDFEMRTFLLA
jgi:hypothetical protein